MESITYRESCYQCVFAQGERAGDITIGDFWGLQNSEELPVNPQMVYLYYYLAQRKVYG